MALRVSEVAQRAGVSPDAVRFYEKEGLLPEPPRSPASYREYDPTTPQRIRFIKGAQEMGLKLAERRIEEIDAEVARLSGLRAELAEMAKLECPATDQGDLWPCEVTFIKRGGERN